MVLNRRHALLVTETKKSSCKSSLFTSSSMKFLDKDGAMTCDDRTLSSVFQRLMSSNCSDATGWFLVLLTCKLITTGFRSKLQISSISRGFTLAAIATARVICPKEEEMSTISSAPSIKIFWDDLDSVLSVIKTTVSSYHVLQLTERERDTLSISMLTAFLSSVDKDSMKCSVIYCQALGLSIENLIVLENTLAMDIPIPTDICRNRRRFETSRTHHKFQNLIVAIFENSLELSELSNYSLEIDGDPNQSEPGGKEASIKFLEYKFLDGIAFVLKSSKVTLVACQRRIHPYLVQKLKKMGIICLPRLSIRYCGALQRLCGARQLVSFPISQSMSTPLDPSSLGYLSSLECRAIYGRNYVVASSAAGSTIGASEEPRCDTQELFTVSAFGQECAQGIRNRQSLMSTVILTAPSESLCNTLQIVCEDVARTLTGLLSCPYVLPGGGAWQRGAAQMLHDELSKCSFAPHTVDDSCSVGTREEVLRAASVFASCLGDCGRIMRGHGTDTPRVISHEFGDDHTRCIVEAITQYDALTPNQNALQLAVDTAICVLDIDGQLISHPQSVDRSLQ